MEEMGAKNTTHAANDYKEPIWVKIDGDKNSHKFEPTNSEESENATGGTFYSVILVGD